MESSESKAEDEENYFQSMLKFINAVFFSDYRHSTLAEIEMLHSEHRRGRNALTQRSSIIFGYAWKIKQRIKATYVYFIFKSAKENIRENYKLYLYSEPVKNTKSKHHIHAHKQAHVSMSELLFDLIFVVSIINLSSLYASTNTWRQVALAFLVFITFWLNWSHTNHILASIRLHSYHHSICMGLIMIGTLGNYQYIYIYI